MLKLDIRITWADGGTVVYKVEAATINEGVLDATRKGTEATYNGRPRQVAVVRWVPDSDDPRQR